MSFVDVPLPGMEHLADNRRTAPVPITQAARNAFWHRVVTTDSGCWIWNGAVGNSGYGRITWTHNGASRTLSAHRFALTLSLGAELPSDLVAAHGCDHPLCVRVGAGHVHLSSQSANLRHAVSTGRHDGITRVSDSRRRREASLSVRAELTGDDTVADGD